MSATGLMNSFMQYATRKLNSLLCTSKHTFTSMARSVDHGDAMALQTTAAQEDLTSAKKTLCCELSIAINIQMYGCVQPKVITSSDKLTFNPES
jgi:hypothetical protein